MKVKGTLAYPYQIILLVIYNLHLIETKKLEWCWTRPILDTKVIPNVQGINWALCEGQIIDLEKIAKGQLPEEGGESEGSSCSSGGSKAKYEIKINMPQDESFVGKSGPYYMTINSDAIQGEEFEFISSAFTVGQQEKIVKEVTNVGEVSSITIRQADGDDGPFACKKVTIVQGATEWDFICNAVLDKNRKVMTMDLNSKTQVTLKIKQSQLQNEKDKGSFPLAIALQGESGVTTFQLVDNYQIDGKERVFETEFQDVGTLKKIHIKSYYQSGGIAKGLLLDSIQATVQGENGPSVYTFNNSKHMRISRNLETIELICGGEGPKASRRKSPAMKAGSSMEAEDVSPNSQPPEPVTNFQNGLEDHESAKMKFVDCTTQGTTVFGNVEFFTDTVNYQVQYVVCPPACNDNSSIMGRSIYHPDSTVCAAGIIDGSIPKSGGLMGVIMVSGQKRYDERPMSYGISISQGNESKWAFSTVKVNNPDFSKSDVRILDYTGVPSFEGRVEFRVGGKWGTVSNEGTSNNFARQVCRALNYKDGDVKNSERGYCREHNGKDYCGFTKQPVHYSHYACSEADTALHQCSRQVTGHYDHEEDVIVKCSNIDKKKQEDLSPQEGTVRLIGGSGSPSTNQKGRVEIYRSGAYGAVCSTGFTNRSAQVACQQMGFDDGKLLGGQEATFKACDNGDENFCVSDSSQLILTNVACNDQSKLGDCGGQVTKECSVEMTTVLQCEGQKGDSTGNSQQKKQEDEIYPPLLGTLPLANPYMLGCETTLDDYLFEGDPGSIYVANCPSGCKEFTGVIHGTGVYDSESSICKSAIHAGVIQDKGGFVTVKLVWPFKNFKDSQMNGLTSSALHWSSKSFQPTKTINWHKKLALEQYNAPVERGLKAPFSGKMASNIRKDPTSFLQITNKPVHNIRKTLNKFSKTFHAYLSKKSFLQMKESQEEDIPTFLWASPVEFKFNKENTIDTSTLEKNENLKTLESFTIMTQIKLEAMQEVGGIIQPSLIIGHSDQNCWSLVVNSNGISFGKLETMLPIGYSIAKNKFVHLAIVYNKAEKSLRGFFKPTGEDVEEKELTDITFDFNCQGIVHIGGNHIQNDMPFNGEIQYVKVFTYNLEEDSIKQLFNKPIPKPITPAIETQCKTDSVLKSTIDQRKCVTPCIRDPMPPSAKAPTPPEEARIGQASLGNLSDFSSNQATQDSETTEDQGVSSLAISLNCNDTLLTKQVKGLPGKSFKFYCNRGCVKSDGFVFGTQVYSQLSSICLAAIHSGLIEQEKGGEFDLILLKSPTTFYKSNNNGLESTTLEAQDQNLAFTLQQAPKIVELTCDQDASDEKAWNSLVGLKHFNCPENCSKINHNVMNSHQEYWYHSSVCQAAIHSGIMTDLGGQGSLTFKESTKVYTGSYHAGINGKNYVNSQLSGKSFVITGSKIQTHNYFTKELEASTFLKQYESLDAIQYKKGPSNFNVVKFPYDENQTVIQNNSEIEDTSSNPQFGAILKREGFESQNGLMKVNLYYDSVKSGSQAVAAQAGLFFRYYDRSNFYVLKLNVPDKEAIQLFKTVNGEEHLLGSKGDAVIFGVWYRYFIAFHEQTIKVYRQIGKMRQVELLFDITDNDVARGKVALATNGDARNLYFDALQVEPFDPRYGIVSEKEIQHREYNQCVVPKSINKRRKMYQEINHTKEDPGMALVLISFCQLCCSRFVEAWERILFHDCYKSCVQVNRSHERTLREQQGKQVSTPWTPKKGKWMDVKLKGSEKWFQGKVIDLIPDEEDSMRMTVKFLVSFLKGKSKEYQVVWPTKDMKPCGSETDTPCKLN